VYSMVIAHAAAACMGLAVMLVQANRRTARRGVACSAILMGAGLYLSTCTGSRPLHSFCMRCYCVHL
jgi:hypothetical protein